MSLEKDPQNTFVIPCNSDCKKHTKRCPWITRAQTRPIATARTILIPQLRNPAIFAIVVDAFPG